MRKLFQLVALIFLCSMANEATCQVRPLVIYDGAVTELRTTSPFTQSKDLWVTLAELTRATGFVVKPQGVCRGETRGCLGYARLPAEIPGVRPSLVLVSCNSGS